jgi:hypothetical protein
MATSCAVALACLTILKETVATDLEETSSRPIAATLAHQDASNVS